MRVSTSYGGTDGEQVLVARSTTSEPTSGSREENSGSMRRQLVCAKCGIIIQWQPTIVDGVRYCCPGCAKGGPCDCDYDNLPLLGDTNPIVLQAARLRAGGEDA